ncbi:DJ-1/PfpI family protein [Lentzea albidocapillata subsp. violacea]|uniref:DJ-1/PfpI family protein n=1 Tax=Lentzea albidocapillata subsp. violacea TaxID=128104 RepID=A0A1G9KR52_9PSEU|nr:DJ-1/PfpI family protein [Lentzea albidocapillata]SDL52084.1 DJ-1/PfpI family protein [Lentzea albidocapillata subsp. violacea]
MRAQVVLFDGFDPLDVIGPYETLTAGGIPAELVTAEGPREVPAGLSLLSLKATARLDPGAGIIVVPGAAATHEDETFALLSAAAATLAPVLADSKAIIATVCGGSLLLGIAGLIKGRNATTNHLGLHALESMGVNAVRARIVDDGDLVTAAGVTSGVDLGLYLVEREVGAQRALKVEELFAHERRGTVWSAA